VALDESSHEHQVQYNDNEWEFVRINSEDYFLRIDSEDLMKTFRLQISSQPSEKDERKKKEEGEEEDEQEDDGR
jgi:hypothetical protein